MLPAADLTEILTNLGALNLQPNTAAQILAAVLAPLLRSTNPEPPVRPRKHAERPRAKPRKAAPQKKAKPRAPAPRPTEARDQARAALKANPSLSLTKVAAIAGVSRSTVCNAARELAAEAHKAARKQARQARATTGSPAAKPLTEPRQRAVCFLRDELAHGPKPVSDLEASAERAHIDVGTLQQARADLHVVTSRADTGRAHAVQWSLPG